MHKNKKANYQIGDLEPMTVMNLLNNKARNHVLDSWRYILYARIRQWQKKYTTTTTPMFPFYMT